MIHRRRLNTVNTLKTNGRALSFLLVCLASGTLSSQEAPYGLTERQLNTTLLLDSPGYALGEMELERVFTDLRFSSSLYLTHAGDGSNRLFVVERSGVVRAFLENNPAQTSVFIDLRDRVRTPSNETGLLSIAFHPRHRKNGLFYIFYTTGDLITRVAEFGVRAGDPLRGDPTSERVLLDVHQPAGNHNGGQIAFGLDGHLYIGLGDGGGSNDVFNNGQDPTTLLGSILRIDVDRREGELAYAIPYDNPFDGSQGQRREIWAWGLRNPWRFSIDRLTGQLWAGDVGQSDWEEVNLIERGGNYGWNTMEGTQCFDPPDACDSSNLVLPAYEYDHSVGRSVTGGYVYRGPRLVRLQGTYLYGDFVNKQVWGLRRRPDGQVENRLLALSPSPIASFGENEQGEVYVVGFDGTIYRLVEKDGVEPPGNIPTKLSAVGLYTDIAARRIAPGVIPYSVNAPFWSDGATKERFIALPGAERIDFSSNGNWAFPARSVLVKSFYLGNQLVETRFMVKRPQGEAWDGYSYMWDGDDATLLTGSATRTYLVDGQERTHYFPSRAECLTCHTPQNGYVLGVRTEQLNGPHAYAEATDNQLRTLDHIGLFNHPIQSATEDLSRLPRYDDTRVPIAARARAYLATNCASCHQPAGTGRGSMDMRFQTPLEQTGLVDVAALYGDLGIAKPRRIAPGNSQQSTLLARMRTLGNDRMPPLASLRVDARGTALVEQWITEWSATAVSPAETVSDDFLLQQNYPNPFNASTRIRYTLSEEGPFSLVVYNALGQRVRKLVTNWGTVGTHTAQWDGLRDGGQAAASGLYFYRLERGEQTQVRRMTLLR